MSENVVVQSLDPTGRPMEQEVAPVEPAKKSRVGMIIGIIVGILAIVGLTTAVTLLVLNSQKTNAVAMAMYKIMSDEAPKNVAIDGDINILVNSPESPIKRMNVDLDSDIVVGSMINTSSAVLTFTDQNNKDYSVKFKELYAANGDLYFEIEGATAALEDSKILTAFGGAPDGVIDVIEAAEGLWLRISMDELNLATSGMISSSTPATCVTNLISEVNKNSNSTAELYGKYPFIVATTDNVAIASKNNPVYHVSLDAKLFTDYVNAINSTELAQSLFSCMGWGNNVRITQEDVEDMMGRLPNMYVEVNSDYNFTRLYFDTVINGGMASATVDLGFSYPTNVNVSEPVEYTNYSDFIQKIFTDMFNVKTEGA